MLALLSAAALADPGAHEPYPRCSYFVTHEDCSSRGSVPVRWSADDGPDAVETCVRREALPLVFDAEVRAPLLVRTGSDGMTWRGGGAPNLVIDGVVASEEVRDGLLLGQRPIPWLPGPLGR